MRIALRLQLLTFLAWGMLSGAAFSFYLDHAKAEAKAQGMAEVLVRLPMRTLSEVKL